MMGRGIDQSPPSTARPLGVEHERSAFIIFAEFASHHVLETVEVRALVTQIWSLKPSLFHIGQKALEELGASLGLDPQASLRAFGRDVEPDTPSKRFVAELRYCPVCLSKGCHSALFQLPAVAYCPVHEVRLRCGCPHCGEAVPASALSVGRNHLYCGKCGRNLATDRRREFLGGEVLQLSSQKFDALRDAATNPDNEERSVVRPDAAPAQVAASVGLSRLLASHTMWFEEKVAGLERFRVQCLPLEVEQPPLPSSRAHALVRNAYISAFVELAGNLEKLVRLDAMPTGADSGTHSGARVDADMQLVGAAFWHAASTFGVHRYIHGEMPPPTARASPFAYSLPRGTQAMRLVVRCQVETLFVLNVLSFRHHQYGAEVAWSKVPEHAKFLMPWRIHRPPGGAAAELQIRARVDDATVSRVVKRYRYDRLTKAPADSDLTAFLRDG